MIVTAVRLNGLDALLSRAGSALLRPRQLLARVGKGLEKELRGHFLARDRESNRHGWPPKHFWNRQIRQNTALTSFTDREAIISIASPAFAHKLKGGDITPKRGRLLAIPATQEAYRAGSPREGGMKDLVRPPGRFFLIQKGKSRVHYWLVPKVTQRADPRALPDMDAVGRRLMAEAERWVAGKLTRGGKV